MTSLGGLLVFAMLFAGCAAPYSGARDVLAYYGYHGDASGGGGGGGLCAPGHPYYGYASYSTYNSYPGYYRQPVFRGKK